MFATPLPLADLPEGYRQVNALRLKRLVPQAWGLAAIRRNSVRCLAHTGSTFSGVGASEKPGAVQFDESVAYCGGSELLPKYGLYIFAANSAEGWRLVEAGG